MPRSMWKGAISFGLVHIPVEMHPAVQEHDLDLTMLDKRDFSPVGFKRYNKGSGKDVSWDNIVKGYEYQDDEYVVLTDEDLKRANVSATQTIDILAFVDAQQVPLIYYEQPYYLAPGKGGDKVYALLRETLRKSDKVGIATVVIRVKQHLCALVCMSDAIMLNTLRYENEIRAADDLKLPPASMKAAGIADKELQMALSLVEGMAEDWKPAQYHDSYHDDVLALVQKKIKAGQTKSITLAEPERKAASSGNVIDLVALLQQSLGKKPGRAAAKAAADNDADDVSLDDDAPSPKPRKTTSTTRRAPAKSAAHADSATTTKAARHRRKPRHQRQRHGARPRSHAARRSPHHSWNGTPASVSLTAHKRCAASGSVAHGRTPKSSVESASTARAMSTSSQYTPPMPCKLALAAHQTVVAAPCSTVLQPLSARTRSCSSSTPAARSSSLLRCRASPVSMMRPG